MALTKAQLTLRIAMLNALLNIQKLAIKCGAQGELTLNFDADTIEDFDAALDSITELPRHKHVVEVAQGLNVKILLN